MGLTMHNDKTATHIRTDSPSRACAFVLGEFARGVKDALVLTRSSQQALYYRAAAAKASGGKLPPGLACHSFNAFVENCPYFRPGVSQTGYAGYDCKAVLLLRAAVSSGGMKLDLGLLNSLGEAVGELKSNRVRVDAPEAGGLSFKCLKLFDIYARYQKSLSDSGLQDYHDRVACLSCDRGFYEFIAASFDAVVFDRLERLSPIETDLCALMIAAARRVIFITDATACEADPQRTALEAMRRRAAAIWRAVTPDVVDVGSHEDGPLKVITEKKNNVLRSYAVREGYISELACRDRAAEADAIARTITALSLEQKLPLSRFAVFMPGFSRSRRFFETTFAAFGLKFQSNEGRGAAEFLSVDRLLRVMGFLATGDPADFVPLVTLPAFKRFVAFAAVPGIRAKVRKLLAITKIFSPAALDGPAAAAAIAADGFASGCYDECLAKLYSEVAAFKATVEKIFAAERYSLHEYFNALSELLASWEFLAGDDEKDYGPFIYAITRMRDFAGEAAGRGAVEKLDAQTAARLLRGLVESAFVPDEYARARKGAAAPDAVIIHTRPNINLFDYDYLFIAGMTEGDLPSAPSSPGAFFLDASDRRLLGLYDHKPQIYSDRGFFHRLLSSSARGVFLSAPAAHLNRALVRSRFFKEVANVAPCSAPPEILCFGDLVRVMAKEKPPADVIAAAAGYYGADRGALESCVVEALRSTAAARDRDRAVKSHAMFDCSAVLEDRLLAHLTVRAENGALKASPTLMEKFYFCPARYFFEKALGLEEEMVYGGELEARDEGDIIHKTLERFFGPEGPRAAIRDYYFDPASRAELKLDLERHLFEAGFHAVRKAMLLERFGQSYHDVKMLQYFNALNGFERNGARTASGIKGYFKNFIDDYLDFLAAQKAFVEPAKVEHKLEASVDCGGRRVEISAKCDRIDVCVPEEGGPLYFFVTDYKTGVIPSPREIRTRRKIQAPFYLFFLENQFSEMLLSGLPVLGRAVKEVRGAGFVYTSLAKLGDDLKPEKRFFSSVRYAEKSSDKIKKPSAAGAPDEPAPGFRLVISQRPDPDFDDILRSVPSMVGDFIEKIARGDFHASIVEGHSCDYCGFKGICHRSEKAAAAAVRRLGPAASIDNGRRL